MNKTFQAWNIAFLTAYDYLSRATTINEYWKEQLATDFAECALWGKRRRRAIYFGFHDCELNGLANYKFRK